MVWIYCRAEPTLGWRLNGAVESTSRVDDHQTESLSSSRATLNRGSHTLRS